MKYECDVCWNLPIHSSSHSQYMPTKSEAFISILNQMQPHFLIIRYLNLFTTVNAQFFQIMFYQVSFVFFDSETWIHLISFFQQRTENVFNGQFVVLKFVCEICYRKTKENRYRTNKMYNTQNYLY